MTEQSTSPDASGGDASTIEFLCDPALIGTIPPPERAVRFAPDWFRRLERELGAG